MHYWLMKSEPSEYSIHDLAQDGRTAWFGVRNYQARNFMSREMRPGDGILFYHSTCPEPGVYGLAEVVSETHPDESQFLPGKYFDPKTSREKPMWFCVDVGFVSKLSKPYLLSEIRANARLSEMRILQKGSRLSITPVTREEYDEITSRG